MSKLSKLTAYSCLSLVVFLSLISLIRASDPNFAGSFEKQDRLLHLSIQHADLNSAPSNSENNLDQEESSQEKTYPLRSLQTAIVPCPAEITNCGQCEYNYGTATTVCKSCCQTCYKTWSGACAACPVGCTSCSIYTFFSYHIHCKSCFPGFKRQSWEPHQCYCSGNQIAVPGNPPTCVTCPVQCATCTTSTTCTSCLSGYYLSGSSCLACMPVCATCTSGSTCSSCKNNLVISGSVCACANPTVLRAADTTCIACSTNDPDCQTCAYDPVYTPAAPTPIICSIPNTGYFVQPDGSTSPCGPFCDICSSFSVCTNCSATFSNNNGTCECVSPVFLTNTGTLYCQLCGTIISGCDTCQPSNGTANTECSACLVSHYPGTTPYPTASCLPCPATCSSCTSDTNCLSCIVPFVPMNSICLCSGLTYVDPTQTNCVSCPMAIFNCLTCNDTLPTTCLTCDPTFYLSVDSLTCSPCPLNCVDCTNSSVCINCTLGLSWNGTDCDCDATCQNCLNITGGKCTACVDSVTCSGCAAGWFLTGVTCNACLSQCLSCLDLTGCTSCKSPFVLGAAGSCVCNNTIGDYLSSNGTTCQPCGTVVSLCTSCTSTPSTVCLSCISGYYPDNNTCLPCPFPCLTCSANSTECYSCQITYTHDPINNTCSCDNSSQMFYSSSTLGCLACGLLIQNCQNCQDSGNGTQCLVCNDPYYADTGSNSCIMCDARCTSCSAPLICGGCATNLVLGNTSFCECNTTLDSTLTYYSTLNLCVSCLTLLSNCQTCNPDPLTCTSCQPGTYLSNSTCLTCPSACATCNSTSCLTCPSGTTLSGSTCICDSSCSACTSSAPACLACTLDSLNLVTACSSCSPGFYISTGGDSCSPCPQKCATCSSASVCVTCLDTYILVGNTCQCQNSLGLFSHQSSCQLCSDIFYGCLSCSFDGTSTSCTSCQDGMYLSGGQCLYCDSSCLKCSSQFVCTACHPDQTLSGSTCTCGAVCANCGLNVANCIKCDLNILGTFSQCTACAATFYLNSSNLCQSCPSPCLTCDSNQNCTSCPPTLQIISGTCSCNSAKAMILNNLTSQCQPCNLYHPFCAICRTNSSLVIGYECDTCIEGYYLNNVTCQEEICGDGIVTPHEQCDDGNDLTDDGCTKCVMEQYYNCTGSPSVCLLSMDFALAFDSVQVSTETCNELTLFFRIRPVYDSYYSANFSKMYATQTNTKLTYQPNSFSYTKGVIGYKFIYTGEVLGDDIKVVFTPKFTGLSELEIVPLTPVYFTMPEPKNILALTHRSQDVCQEKQSVNTALDVIQYASFGVLLVSALPAKIVGLELFGVLQLAFLSLGSMDHLNPLHSSFTKLSAVNGLSLKLDQDEPTNTRRLQSTALTPNRVQTIGYASNFLRNCNLMFIVVAAVMVMAFVLYLFTCFCKQFPCFYSISRRIFKQVLLTLILFNCFNFAYCAGLHFAYADRTDHLFGWGTLAAVVSMMVPLMMVVVLQCTEDQGFGQYKDKFKPGKIQRAYFMITIIYRMVIGYYLATMNEQPLSTLIVLLVSIYFLIYNLVNLPFTKAYHNYRANICHLSQFLILYITMFYRSMNDGSTSVQLDALVSPVYVELAALSLCILASAIVLVVDIYFWVKELIKSCQTKPPSDESEQNMVNIVETEQTIKNNNVDEQFVFQSLESYHEKQAHTMNHEQPEDLKDVPILPDDNILRNQLYVGLSQLHASQRPRKRKLNKKEVEQTPVYEFQY